MTEDTEADNNCATVTVPPSKSSHEVCVRVTLLAATDPDGPATTTTELHTVGEKERDDPCESEGLDVPPMSVRLCTSTAVVTSR